MKKLSYPLTLFFSLGIIFNITTPVYAKIYIGLNADMSSGSAQAGQAIRRGILIAIEEINQSGGVLGESLELLVTNHRGIPAKASRPDIQRP